MSSKKLYMYFRVKIWSLLTVLVLTSLGIPVVVVVSSTVFPARPGHPIARLFRVSEPRGWMTGHSPNWSMLGSVGSLVSSPSLSWFQKDHLSPEAVPSTHVRHGRPCPWSLNYREPVFSGGSFQWKRGEKDTVAFFGAFEGAILVKH